MDIDFDMNEISLRDDDIEAVPEIIVSVMSMMKNRGKYLNRKKKRGTVSELTEKHTKFITDIVDECSTATVAGIHELLLKEFPSLSVSPSAVYRHLRTSCALSMKKLEKISSARNS
ncbi:hypothetical protein BD560DRAFT_427404 [Blakeslea trispora]|nr:hypothetical protein BD560DRAFT_427404 [Blakeslea trispora]